jgi:hypothetical protein
VSAEGELAFGDLVAETRARAAADANYLGSEDQRGLLEGYLKSIVPDVRVAWQQAGQCSYFDRRNRVVALELPRAGAVAPDETAETAAVLALHESLHAAYSGDVGSKFRMRVGVLRRESREFVEYLFNHIEDARVGHRCAADDPSTATFLEKFEREALRQQLVVADSRRNRFLNALLERLLLGVAPTGVETEVATALAEAEPHIAGALAGSTRESGLAALEIARICSAEGLDEPPPAPPAV